MSSQNKVALVTGSTSGIGLATADALAKRGVDVIVTGFGEQSLIDSIVTQLEGYGVRANYIPADLSKLTDIDNLWSKVIELYPDGIDILVNNAGVLTMRKLEETSDADWDLTIAVNLTAPFQLTKRCLAGMRKKGWGRIVNTSSTQGLVSLPKMAAYVASKHGLIGLTKTTALENGAFGITCNAVCPGTVDTPMPRGAAENLAATTGMTADEVMNLFTAAHATGLVIQPDQIADMIEFLCLSKASSQMTGCAYSVDAGHTAQ